MYGERENRIRLIMSNVRRLLSKAQNKRMPNWVLYKNVFGVGRTTAYKTMNEMGIDPETTEIKF